MSECHERRSCLRDSLYCTCMHEYLVCLNYLIRCFSAPMSWQPTASSCQMTSMRLQPCFLHRQGLFPSHVKHCMPAQPDATPCSIIMNMFFTLTQSCGDAEGADSKKRGSVRHAGGCPHAGPGSGGAARGGLVLAQPPHRPRHRICCRCPQVRPCAPFRACRCQQSDAAPVSQLSEYLIYHLSD